MSLGKAPAMKVLVAFTISLALSHLGVAAEEEHHDDDDHGDEHGDHEDHEDEHGDHEDHGDEMAVEVAFGGAAVVHIITLLAVLLLLIPSVRSKFTPSVLAVARSFAAGALLSAAVFLMLPEAAHLIGEDVKEESMSAAVWGASILGGIFFLLVVDTLVTSVFKGEEHEHIHGPELSSTTAPGSSAEGPEDVKKVKSEPEAVAEMVNPGKYRLMAAIAVGDAFHNFVDGAFIGAAFRLCSPGIGWGIVLTTIAHELSQELADVLVLFSSGWSLKHCAISNFGAGLSIYVGAALTLYSTMSPSSLGVILAIGGGVFIYTSAVECLSHQVRGKEVGTKLQLLLAFALGVLVIGLVLINHEHCGEHGHGDDHDDDHEEEHHDHDHDDH
eukprot:CAMPEP_0185211486 /NCGR_PEP_ID=MMETSP1140-20130426/67046_1 /TAXON_ID=298111 /ORGANISM="Pavlova sp., Strain CCMP459" /LENGTH=384 /DNA_ID=CAMNT_0027779329 /DNA_START=25 /DNA_END=1179 /DNA_ORIENTATION=+